MKNTSLAKLAGILLIIAVLILITLFLTYRTSTEPAPPLASGPSTRPAGEPLFTLSPETTAITAPLHPDGTPDYVAAMNARYGQGVTPENNAFTAWIEVMGTGEGVLPESKRDAILAMAGAKPSDAKWVSFEQYCEQHNHSELGAGSRGPNAEQLAEMRPWKDEQFPIVAAFLKERGPALDAARQAWSRPRYWAPAVGNTLYSVIIPGLGPMQDASNALLARAMQHAGGSDFDGFLSDLFAVRHLAHLLFTAPTIIERLSGAALEKQSNRVIAAAGAGGAFSAGQCDRLRAALLSDSPRPNIADAIDIEQRWGALDVTLMLAAGHTELVHDLWGDDQTYRSLATIDPDAVDWDAVLKQLNATTDLWIQAVQQPGIEEVHAAIAEITRTHPSFHRLKDLTPKEGESRKEYTARVADALDSVLVGNMGRAEELCWESHMHDAMALALLAAAHHHAVAGQWPQSLEQLVPHELAAVPMDMYAPGGKEPVHYVLTPTGPALYSVGRNHYDDGGLRNASAGQDDLAVGAPIPNPDAPALP